MEPLGGMRAEELDWQRAAEAMVLRPKNAAKEKDSRTTGFIPQAAFEMKRMNPAIEAGFTIFDEAASLLMKPVPGESFSCFHLQCAGDKVGMQGKSGRVGGRR